MDNSKKTGIFSGRFFGKLSKRKPETEEEGGMEISSPMNFMHRIHVQFNGDKFIGMPDAWNDWLAGSNIR